MTCLPDLDQYRSKISRIIEKLPTQEVMNKIPTQEILSTFAVGMIATMISLLARVALPKFRESQKKGSILLLSCLLCIAIGALAQRTGMVGNLGYLAEPLLNNAIGKGVSCLVGAAMPHAGCIKNAISRGVEETVSTCAKGAKSCSKALKNVGGKIQSRVQDCMAKKNEESPAEAISSSRNTRSSQRNHPCGN